jgi:hypothetical protein
MGSLEDWPPDLAPNSDADDSDKTFNELTEARGILRSAIAFRQLRRFAVIFPCGSGRQA